MKHQSCRSASYANTPHASLRVECDWCPNVAVFHWRGTYPWLLLCRDDLEEYMDDIRASEARERARWREIAR